MYCFPCDAERVLKIDTKTDVISTIGPEFLHAETGTNLLLCGLLLLELLLPPFLRALLRVRCCRHRRCSGLCIYGLVFSACLLACAMLPLPHDVNQ